MSDSWTRDEYLVTLDLYLNHDVAEDESDPQVKSTARLIDRTPGSVALRLANYRHLDPTSTKGMSNVGSACREIWEEYYGNEEELAHEAQAAKARLQDTDETTTITSLSESVTTDETTTQTTTRHGQRDFRAAIRDRYDDTCLCCEIARPGLLQASHILDWSEFPELRGDPENGLLLCYTHHRAFDLGLFTISSDYELVVRPDIEDTSDLFSTDTIDFKSTPPAAEYLQQHNERLPWWPPGKSES